MKAGDNKETLFSPPLKFAEFMEICADSGIITDSTAKRICHFAKYQGGVGALPASLNIDKDLASRFKYLLGFSNASHKSFNNYIASEDNFHAIELARTVALIPRIWRNLSPVLFYGHTGQGKTHLLSAMARASGQKALLLNTNDLMMEYKYCREAGKELDLLNWITRHHFLLLDDIQFAKGNYSFQKFFCSVYNRMSSDQNAIVLCSNIEPEDDSDYHRNFYSRIISGITIKLNPLDFKARVEVLKQCFSESGFGPNEETINFIASTINNNVRTLKAAVRAIVAYQLASPGRTFVDLSEVKRILKSLHFFDVTSVTGEAVLSSENKLNDLSVTSSAAPPITIEDEERASAEEKQDEQNTDEGSKTSDEYRVLVASAETVDKQIEALLLAAEQHIQQLRDKRASREEIAKLKKAIEYLKSHDLESAMLVLK